MGWSKGGSVDLDPRAATAREQGWSSPASSVQYLRATGTTSAPCQASMTARTSIVGSRFEALALAPGQLLLRGTDAPPSTAEGNAESVTSSQSGGWHPTWWSDRANESESASWLSVTRPVVGE